MSPRLVTTILKKDFSLGPRSAVFLWALVLPLAITLILQVAFGSLFQPKPRLGVVDEGGSQVARDVRAMEGIRVREYEDAEALRAAVEANDVDAGIVLPRGFDEAVKAGERPELTFWISGESYASNRIVLAVTTIDLLRALEGKEPPVEVRVESIGEAGLPISVRLVPVIVFYALVMAGLFVPGSSLVEEKEQGTLKALLVTPARTADVLLAKWLLGIVLASVMSVVTLVLNGALGSNWPEVLVVVFVAAMLSSALGIVIGAFAPDSQTMFGIVKGSGILLFAPVAFYVFPDWPQWIAKLFPLYWIIEPIWRVAVLGGHLSEVLTELAVALGITAALGALAWSLGKRMQVQVAAR
ncbi:MAG: ABC transporter permease [Anaerosomatales bacterium]|nr:ABC transporter permease [Anaerosomatales bacterium]